MGYRTIPMFPLGLVLFPGQVLPLHVFEDRYRIMVEEIIDKDREFGVVLIERGSEVGGGDTRKNVGTLAEIIDSEKSNDGRWLLLTEGTKRIETSRWLEDSPYPRAEVSFLDEDKFLPHDTQDWLKIVTHMRRVLAVLAELGDDVAPISIDISEDPHLGSFQMSSILPITPFDSQKLLEVDSVRERCTLLKRFLANLEETASSRLLE
ncbi:MAG: LON peptidase substrate-binding domain-containing protein [Acidimicrobiales bacterium]|nr:LON peptidase substrate-binding domain-containing protein [Acidimicrobiales bacterium]